MTDQTETTISSKRPWLGIILHTIIPAAVALILFAAAFYFFAIPQYKQSVYEQKQQLIKDMADMAHSLLEHYHRRALEGELTVEESQRRVIERIRSLRYGPEQKDYFWINDLEAKMILHPYRTDLEGQYVLDYRDPEGKPLFREFIEVARHQQAGYVDYFWQWKDDPNQIVHKLSYVRLFEPWGWVIGTGVYTEDVQREVAAMIRNLQMIFAGIFVVVLLIVLYLIARGIRVETLRQAAEQERETLLEKLKEKNHQIQDFVYAVSHDLRAPLINIHGFSEELARSCKDLLNSPKSSEDAQRRSEEIHESIHFIRSNVEKMETLINGLLELSRVGTKTMTLEPVHMNEEIKKVIALLQYQIQSTQARIHVGTLPPCLADSGQISQVFCNLIDNALKYRHPERRPEIRITGVPKHHEVEYTIADNGIGIEAEHLDRIFDVFAQIQPNPDGGGVGLGLTIVKRILELMGGQIRVQSQPGRGTAFTIRLPSP